MVEVIVNFPETKRLLAKEYQLAEVFKSTDDIQVKREAYKAKNKSVIILQNTRNECGVYVCN